MEEPDQRDYLMGDPPKAGVAYDLLSDLTIRYLNPDVGPDDWDVTNYQIQIKNIYEEDAHVFLVKSSCGCTTPQITKTDRTWTRMMRIAIAAITISCHITSVSV